MDALTYRKLIYKNKTILINLVEENATELHTGIIKMLMIYCNLTNNKMLIILSCYININKQKLYEQQLSIETYFNLVSKIIAKFIFTKYFFV